MISPEGCAAILWKDRAAAAKAAQALKITAKDLLKLGLTDEIHSRALGGAHTDTKTTAANLKVVLEKHLTELLGMTVEERLKKRYEKFRAFGHYNEKKAEPAESAKA